MKDLQSITYQRLKHHQLQHWEVLSLVRDRWTLKGGLWTSPPLVSVREVESVFEVQMVGRSENISY